MSFKPVIFTILIVLGLLLGTSGALAQTALEPNGPTTSMGTAFTYQGQLKQSGSAVTNSCDFQFSLWDAATNGMQVASMQAVNAVTVTNGLFTVSLDFGMNAFTGSGRWLDISVRCPTGSGAYTPLTPRQALTPAPYAVYAGNSGALQGNPVGYSVPSTGQVLKWDGSAWSPANDATGNGWSLTGNAGTTSTNFIGTTDNMTLTLAVNGAAALRLEPNATSPNLIGGSSGNQVAAGFVGAVIGGGGEIGASNYVTGDFSTIGGGLGNIITGAVTTIGGGTANFVSGTGATIAGGMSNIANVEVTAIGGGVGNVITDTGGGSVIAGGVNNAISATLATIGGGANNAVTADGVQSVIGGGNSNTISGPANTVGGGLSNAISTTLAFIGGGTGNIITTTGVYAVIGGGSNNMASEYATLVAGGDHNTASGENAVVVGGYNNLVGGSGSFIGGGASNVITTSASVATIAGGMNNVITGTGSYGTIPGGQGAQASHYGEMAYASGMFNLPGDAQTSMYVLRNTAPGANPTELFLNGSNQRLTFTDNRTIVFDILVVGRLVGNSAGYQIRGVAENYNGTFSIVGAVNKTVLAEDDASWDVTVTADNATKALKITVTGPAGFLSSSWVASVRTVEMAY